MTDQKDYAYTLPEELIASTPASPRDSSRLMVYDTLKDTIAFDAFRNLGNHLPSSALLVFNNTKVVPARLHLIKPTGGKVEVFLLLNELQGAANEVRGMTNRKVEPGWKLSFPDGEYLEVLRQEETYFVFRPSMGRDGLWGHISKYGTTPIPKYINSDLPEKELREKYQSMFAKHPASVAAPTASLHFTPRLMENLHKQGVKEAHITLHVGPGTFAPVTEENFTSGKLHTEHANVGEEAAREISEAKKAGVLIIPVGTTALRTLESYGREYKKGDALPHGERAIDLFIHPPYDFRVADGLITNFHLPKSSLMMLVDAYLKWKGAKRGILDLYSIAIEKRFRFYSFGDAMLIL